MPALESTPSMGESRRPCDLTVTFDDGRSTQCHALILE